MMPRRGRDPLPDLAVIGWREWVALPELGVDRIKCKVDTGARSSSLHVHYLERFHRGARAMVRFGVHPRQRDRSLAVDCEAEVADERLVTDSGGHRQRRIVIVTPLVVGTRRFPVEVTLSDRDTMRFRMLLGRTAMRGRYLVHPSRSYLAGSPIASGAADEPGR